MKYLFFASLAANFFIFFIYRMQIQDFKSKHSWALLIESLSLGHSYCFHRNGELIERPNLCGFTSGYQYAGEKIIRLYYGIEKENQYDTFTEESIRKVKQSEHELKVFEIEEKELELDKLYSELNSIRKS